MKTSDTRRRLATVADASAYVGVHPRTVRRWISAGRLRAYYAGPRLVRVDMEELDRMLRPVWPGDGQPGDSA